MKVSVSGGTSASRQPRREPRSTAAIPGREGALSGHGETQAGASYPCPCLGTHLLVQTCKTLLPHPELGWVAQRRILAGAADAAQGHGPRRLGFRHSGRPPEAGGAAGPGGCGASAILRLPYGCTEKGRIRADGGLWRRPDELAAVKMEPVRLEWPGKRLSLLPWGTQTCPCPRLLSIPLPCYSFPAPEGPGFLGNLSHRI